MFRLSKITRSPDHQITRLTMAAVAVLFTGIESPEPPEITRLDPPASAGSMGVNLARSGDTVIVSWLEPPTTARTCGFPRVRHAGENLVLDWLEPSDPARVHAALVPASGVRFDDD